MQFDVTILPDNLNKTGTLARSVENYGFSGLWTAETAHNPFFPLTHAAAATQRIKLGTAIAVAFPRSPMVTAQIAWDLAGQSNGRFILGLGTQVKAHITKRFSMPWTPPMPRMREYVQSLRAIWHSFQTGERLKYEGRDYQFSLMTPFFNPGPIEHPDIPIYVAGVGDAMCRMAGEVCDGLHVHPFHTVRYLEEVIIPNIWQGAERTERTLDDIALSCAIFVVTGRSDEEMRVSAAAAKAQIAFYASTPSYAPVLELHGWQETGAKLSQMARTGQWSEMWKEISDTMLDEVAVIAPPDDLPHKVKERYEGLLNRVGYYMPFLPDDESMRHIWDAATRVFDS